jgi:hypothetical protein
MPLVKHFHRPLQPALIRWTGREEVRNNSISFMYDPASLVASERI